MSLAAVVIVEKRMYRVAVNGFLRFAGICLRRDSWNTTAVTQKCTACLSLAARGFRSLKSLWYNGVPP